MYITPIEKRNPSSTERPKRKQNAGESTFAEEVESLLEVDAVVLSKDDLSEDKKRQNAGERKPAQSDDAAEPSEGQGLNIRA